RHGSYRAAVGAAYSMRRAGHNLLRQAVSRQSEAILDRRRQPRSRSRGALLEPDVDLGDLELARGAARDLHGDGLVALAADERAADGRLVGKPVLLRARLGGADDRVLDRLAGLFVF